MDSIKVSVSVPVFGVENYIERCCRSLFEQTMTEDIEFVFVNDATEDRSIEVLKDVLKSYPLRQPQVRIINHEHRRGVAAARMTCLNHARGEYVIQLDADDYFEPDMISSMFDMAKATDADVVVCDFYMAYSSKEEYYECLMANTKEEIIRQVIYPKQLHNLKPYLWNKLIRRSLIFANKAFPIEGLDNGEDFIICVPVLYYANKIVKINKAFIHYVKYRKESITYTRSAESSRHFIFVMEYIYKFFLERNPDYAEAMKRRIFYVRLRELTNPNVGIEMEQEILAYHPEIGIDKYEEYKCYISPHWRLPYKMALRGHLRLFHAMKRIINTARNLRDRLR